MVRSRASLRLGAIVLLTLSTLAFPAAAQQLTVIGFNVESGGADPQVIAATIAPIDGTDIWGFSEVQNADWAEMFEEAAAIGENASFDQILGTTGRGDRLLIIYDEDRFEKLRHMELHHLNIDGTVRAPLVAHFREKATGTEFLFVVNHLARGDKRNGTKNRRHKQAQGLNEWARQQTLPVIAVGDYNFDWNLPNGDTDHDRGYDLLTAGSAFVWVRPPSLIPTLCSDRFTSVLDFVFVAGEAKNWMDSSEILFSNSNYCPDDDTTSDHRPVLARFDLAEPEGVTRALLLQRIQKIEEELGELKELIRKLDSP